MENPTLDRASARRGMIPTLALPRPPASALARRTTLHQVSRKRLVATLRRNHSRLPLLRLDTATQASPITRPTATTLLLCLVTRPLLPMRILPLTTRQPCPLPGQLRHPKTALHHLQPPRPLPLATHMLLPTHRRLLRPLQGTRPTTLAPLPTRHSTTQSTGPRTPGTVKPPVQRSPAAPASRRFLRATSGTALAVAVVAGAARRQPWTMPLRPPCTDLPFRRSCCLLSG